MAYDLSFGISNFWECLSFYVLVEAFIRNWSITIIFNFYTYHKELSPFEYFQ